MHLKLVGGHSCHRPVYNVRRRFAEVAMKALPFLFVFLAVSNAFAQSDFPIRDFTKSPTEHIINRIDDPIIVPSVRGVITLQSGDSVLEGALFEIEVPGARRPFEKPPPTVGVSSGLAMSGQAPTISKPLRMVFNR